MLVSLFRQETLRRSELPVDQRQRFHLYCDEVHRFVTDSLEELLAEGRKYNVGLTLAHQYLRQLARGEADALSSVESKVIFAVNESDAELLKKDLLGMVCVEDLIAQEDFQAIARIGRKVVRVCTPQWTALTGTGHRDRILERSRKLYCKPTAEVVATIRRRRAELDQSVPTQHPSRRLPPHKRRGPNKRATQRPRQTGEGHGDDHDTF
jgi:hypothetical protein